MVVKDKYVCVYVSGNVDSVAEQIQELLNQNQDGGGKWILQGSPFVFEGKVHQYVLRKTMLVLQPDGEYK